MTSQKKIDQIQIANKVIAELMRSDGQARSPEYIARASDIELSSVKSALEWCKQKEYSESHNGMWTVTREGVTAYFEALDTAITIHDVSEFKLEVLTGMDASGEQTKYTAAALPKNKRYRNDIDPVDICDASKVLNNIAKELGITFDECRKGMETGSIKMCKGLAGMDHHWGIFHPHRSKRDGVRWQDKCIKCCKIRRKKGVK